MEIYSSTVDTTDYSFDRCYHSSASNNHWTSFLLSILYIVRTMMATIDGCYNYSFMIESITTGNTIPIALCATTADLSTL